MSFRPLVRIGVVKTKNDSSSETAPSTSKDSFFESSSSLDLDDEHEPNFSPAKRPKQHAHFIRTKDYFIGKDCACPKECLTKFPLADLLAFETDLKTLTLQKQKAVALKHMVISAKWTTEGAFRTFSQPIFWYKGIEICSIAFQFLFDLTDNGLKDLLSWKRQGLSDVVPHRRVGTKLTDTKADDARGWIRSLLEAAEHVPNMNMSVVSGYTCMRTIYQIFRNNMITAGIRTIATEGMFRLVWKELTTDSQGDSTVYVGKARDGVVYCGICAVLNLEYAKAFVNQREIIKETLLLHKKQATFSRNHYEDMKTAGLDPHKQVDVIELDGAFFHCSDKRYLHYYLDLKEYPKNSDRVISLIVWTLLRKRGPLGRNLFLQLDGAAENKNAWVFGFAALLTTLNIFDKVTISFLPPGHTHISIDRGFGRISVALRSESIYTPGAFEAQILASHEKPKPTLEHLSGSYMFGFKDWIEPFLIRPFSNIKNPHYWEFYKKDGVARMRYKNHLIDEEWFPSESDKNLNPAMADGYRIFAEEPTPAILDDMPCQHKPLFDTEELERVKASIPKDYEHLWTQEQTDEWEKFFQETLPQKMEPAPTPEIWSLKALYWKALERDAAEKSWPSTFERRFEGGAGKLDLVKKRIYGTDNPVRVGPQGKPVAEKIPAGNIRTLQKDTFAILRPDTNWGKEKLAENPQIDFLQQPWVAKLISEANFETNEVEILWFDPNPTRNNKQEPLDAAWYPRVKQRKTKKQPEILDTQTVNIGCIESFNHKLTKAKKLTEKMKHSAKDVMTRFAATLQQEMEMEAEQDEILEEI